MVELLAGIAERSADENPYLGDLPLRRAQARFLAQSAEMSTARLARQHHVLGLLHLRAGNPGDAVNHLSSAEDLVERLPAGERPPFGAELPYLLGVASMRWGVTRNCTAMCTSQGCIFPIDADRSYEDREPSLAAIGHFRRAIRSSPPASPQRACAGWLLNIAHMTAGDYPEGVPRHELIDPAMLASDEAFPRFEDVAPGLGLNAFDLCGGAVAEDLDRDGRIDVLVSTWDTRAGPQLFRNRGDGSFEDRTVAAGLAGLHGGLNMVSGDYDGDGDVDVLVLRGAWLVGPAGQHPNSLLRNDGDGNFVDVTFRSGLGDEHYPTQTASWADYDNDGDLDLYVGNEAAGEHRFPCQLFRNAGDGTFTDVAAQAGVQNYRYAKGVSWGDYDADGAPDLYVSNLGSENRLYHNEGDGTFVDVARESGVARPLDSFPCWFWDFDNDGALDLYVTSYHQTDGLYRLYPVVAGYLSLPHGSETARLYRGDGTGRFTDVTAAQRLDRPSLPMGANFGDLDNDGFLDFYLGTGYPFYDGLMPNVMYRNRRGRGFADVTTAGGFGLLQKGHGVAFADFDDDGDQDVFEQMGGAYPGDGFGNVLFENPGFGHHWLEVRLTGVRSNTSAVGARLHAVVDEGGEQRSIFRHVGTGGSFGCNPLAQHIGLGAAERVVRLEVFWPTTGETQVFTDVPIDRKVEVTEGSPELEVRAKRPFRLVVGPP